MIVSALAAASTARRVSDLALLVGAVGALFVAWGAAAFLRGSMDDRGRRQERVRTLVGSLLVAAAFLMLLVARVLLA